MQSRPDDRALKGKRGKLDRISTRFTNPAYIEQAAKPAPGPQAVVKVISQARGFRAQRLMEYIGRAEGKDGDKELPFEDSKGEVGQGKEAIEAKYQEWREKFERAKPGQKNPPRHVTHMMLSASCDNNDKNAKKVLAAAREVLQDQLAAKGYDYIMVMHRDTDRPHIHVAINNYNMDADKRKLRLNPPELFELRTAFAERLQALGIEQMATLRRDRPVTLDQVRQGMAELKERGGWLQAKMRSASVGAHAGRLVDFGRAPYNFDDRNERSYYVELQTSSGPRVLWGKDLERALGDAGVRKGESVELERAGKVNVKVNAKTYDDRGRLVESQEVAAEKGLWNVKRVEKGQEKAPPILDALAERERIAKAITRMREQVKQVTGPLTKERKEYMQALRELSDSLIQPGADIQRQLDVTIKRLEREHGQVRAFAQDLRGTADAPKLTFRQKLQRQRMVEKLSDRALKNIDGAMKIVKDAGMPAEQKQKALQQLRSLQRGFSKGMGMGL